MKHFLLAATGALLPAQSPSLPFFALPAAATATAEPLTTPVAEALSMTERAARARARGAELDPARFDLALRAQALAPGLTPAFALLRDEIGVEVYSGVLRGAAGTYRARAGNALDRALLLATMLRARGVTVRFAHGTLDEARARQLVARVFEPRAEIEAPKDLGAAGLPERVRARARRDHTALRSAVGTALPAPGAATADDLLAEVRAHTWVQVQLDDVWFDLDPAFKDLKLGQRAAEVATTADELAAPHHQTVTIRVRTQTLVGGALRDATVLERSAPAAAWLDADLFLVHASAATLGRSIASALGSSDARPWTPILVVGDELQAGTPIAYEARQTSVLDVLGGDGPDPNAPTFVAEWLEVEFAAPDGKREVHRRCLLDRAGPVVRARGAFAVADLAPLAADAQGPLVAQQIHNLAFGAAPADRPAFFAAVGGLCDGLARLAAAGDEVQLADEPGNLWPLALQTRGGLAFSAQYVAPALNDHVGVRLFAAAPRLWIQSLMPDAANPGAYQLVLDLRRDNLRGVVASTRELPALAERKLWFALLEGALEHELVADALLAAGGDPDGVATTSSYLGGGALRVLRTRAPLPDEILGEDQRTRIDRALARQSLVVVPIAAGAAGEVAFWELDAHGDTRAVYGDDWNGALAPGRGNLPRPPIRGSPNGGNVWNLTKNGRIVRGGASDSTGYGATVTTISIPGAIAIGVAIVAAGAAMSKCAGCF